MSYLQDRLNAYHITDEINTFKAQNDEGRTISTWRFFTENDKGDIQINYLTPDGTIAWYNHGNVQTRDFCRVRYADPEKHKGKDGKPTKYFQEKGTEMMPFSTPAIIEAYRKKQDLKTLYIVEGEFKAFTLSMLGQPTIGIGGIFNFKDATKTKMHPDIIDVIQTLHVQNVVLIFDKDCIEVKWEESKDLSERLNYFYLALNCFNELLKPYNVQLYFCHVSPKVAEKGIDDLLLAKDTDVPGVLDELHAFTSGMPKRSYLYTYQISGQSAFRIMQIFGLDSVQTFYKNYSDVVEDHDFIWKGNTYYIEDGKPQVSWMAKTKEYVRVGIDYYRRVAGIYGTNTEINLVPWKSGTIQGDYGKRFLSQVQKFDGFANIPNNDPDSYKRVILAGKDDISSILYNLYSPVTHRAVEGDWKMINRLIHHIFDYKNCKGEPLYEMALDYLQLIYEKPAQHLPILCLVSAEQATGKTTFLQLLKGIFGENMRILDSKRLSGNFNSHWAGKLIVATDEAFLDTEKKEVSNTLKMIATNDTVPMEGKGKNAVEVSNFAKLIMCSNDEKSFARIEAEDTRYWVVKVQSIPKDERDPHLQEKMTKEIPAFLHFLKNRQLYYKEQSRLWFDMEDYDTPAHRAVQERTEIGLVKHIKDVIKSQFFYMRTDKVEISLNILYKLVETQYKFADKQKIGEYMHDRGLRTKNATYFNVAYGYEPTDVTQYKDRVYTLFASDWLTADEIADLKAKDDAMNNGEGGWQ